ncbi:NAD(P)-binding protein [Rickenella mellea]|uniref:NAD(P)-binding protein n=1 Tax=Rickenella mellea TaxID=50990 RepID=A0A4Y7QFS0_9AGAM|nr:NAD(P)-binding protein [Rickenella mellea]
MPPTVTRVAIVGTGSRGLMYVQAVAERPNMEIVAFCEPNSIRAEYYNVKLEKLMQHRVPVYKPDGYLDMLRNEKVDTVVITCIDALHDLYIVPALEANVHVFTEKPMTTDVEKCRAINQASERTSAPLTVTFNYRYNPVHEAVKRLIASGEIGNVLSVHFEWLLDTVHGADYFRRWHRQKKNSGGLMVHKSGHHFDLVNWWLDADPLEVAGFGKLAFYGDAAGKKHGLAKDYKRSLGSDVAKQDPFAIQLQDDPLLKKLYVEAENEDGYFRDKNVFAPDIDIEDDVSLLVRYSTGATLSYHLTAYSPWEGYRVMFNGSNGRIELEVVECPYSLPSQEFLAGEQVHKDQSLSDMGRSRLSVHPLWAPPHEVDVKMERGGHGGGDRRMLNVLFGPRPGEEADTGDAAKQKAGVRDGTMALAVGLAANESFRTGKFEMTRAV